MRVLLVICAAVAMVAALPAAVDAEGVWLDQDPPMQWNQPGMALPTGEALDSETFPGQWCSTTARAPETAEDHAMADAGWFLMGGYAAGWGIRVVGGNGAYDGMCRPVGYQYFVFVDGVFAGTLSPQIMNSRFDGAGWSPSVEAPDRVAAEFDRYGPGDPLCCPSGRSVAHFRIKRSDAGVVAWLSFVVSQRVDAR